MHACAYACNEVMTNPHKSTPLPISKSPASDHDSQLHKSPAACDSSASPDGTVFLQ